MGDEDKSGFKGFQPGGSVGVEKKGEQKEVAVGNEKKPAGGGGTTPAGASKKLSFGPVFKKEAKGEVWSSKKEGSDDKTFATVLEGKASVEVLSGSVDLAKKSAKLTVVEGKVEVTGVHGQVDLVDKLKHFLFGDDPKPKPPPAAPTSPMAARVGDLTTHLGPLAPGPGSSNVFIGGMPAWRVGLDFHLCPAPGTPHGAGPAAPGAPTVLINGAPAARATDFVVEPSGGPDVIALGCPTVFIGIPTPPPAAGAAAAPAAEDPWVIFESVASGDLGSGELEGDLGAEGDLKGLKGKGEAKAEAMIALLKGELPLKVRVRIPFTSYYLGLGVKVEGTLLSAGAGANASVKINDGKTLFEASAGAKAGAGIGGVGAKFGLDVSKK